MPYSLDTLHTKLSSLTSRSEQLMKLIESQQVSSQNSQQTFLELKNNLKVLGRNTPVQNLLNITNDQHVEQEKKNLKSKELLKEMQEEIMEILERLELGLKSLRALDEDHPELKLDMKVIQDFKKESIIKGKEENYEEKNLSYEEIDISLDWERIGDKLFGLRRDGNRVNVMHLDPSQITEKVVTNVNSIK